MFQPRHFFGTQSVAIGVVNEQGDRPRLRDLRRWAAFLFCAFFFWVPSMGRQESTVDVSEMIDSFPLHRWDTSSCEYNGDLYEAAGAADATACSRIGSCGGLR